MDMREWANAKKKIAEHHVALAEIYLALDMQTVAGLHMDMADKECEEATAFDKAADELDRAHEECGKGEI